MGPTGRCRIDEEPMEAAGPVDAQNAPTVPWKTTKQFSTSFHRHGHATSEGDISNELRMGTFLTSFDNFSRTPLTIDVVAATLITAAPWRSPCRARQAAAVDPTEALLSE